ISGFGVLDLDGIEADVPGRFTGIRDAVAVGVLEVVGAAVREAGVVVGVVGLIVEESNVMVADRNIGGGGFFCLIDSNRFVVEASGCSAAAASVDEGAEISTSRRI